MTYQTWQSKWILIALLAMTVVTPLSAETLKTINYPMAVQIALNSNPKIKASESDIGAASATILESRGSTLPKVDLEWHGIRSNNPANVFAYKLAQRNAAFADFGFQQFSGPNSLQTRPNALNAPGYYSNFDSGLVLNIPIYSGGKDWARIKRAQFLFAAAKQNDQKARNELLFNLLQVYQGVHAADAAIKATQAHLHSANLILQQTKSLFEQTLVLKSDVLTAENYQRMAKIALQAAIAERNNQIDAFRILLGSPHALIKPGVIYQPLLKNSSPHLLEKHALQTNADLQLLKLRIEAEHSNIDMVEANKKPQVHFQVRHDWNSNKLALAGASDTAMLNINWRVLDFGEQQGVNKKAYAEYQHAIAEYDNGVNQVRLAIIETYRNLEIAKLQLQASQLNAHQEATIVQTLKKRYGENATTLGPVLDAQSRFTSAKMQESISRNNIYLAKAQLLILSGQFKP